MLHQKTREFFHTDGSKALPLIRTKADLSGRLNSMVDDNATLELEEDGIARILGVPRDSALGPVRCGRRSVGVRQLLVRRRGIRTLACQASRLEIISLGVGGGGFGTLTVFLSLSSLTVGGSSFTTLTSSLALCNLGVR